MKFLFDLLPPERALSPTQENALFRSADGRSNAVLHNMREAFAYAKYLCKSRMADGAIFSLVYSALSNAARRYRPSMNKRFAKSRFFGYAKPYIRGELSRTWKKQNVVPNSRCISLEALWASMAAEERENGPQDNEAMPIYDTAVEPEFDAIHTRERWEIVAPIMHKTLTCQEKMVIDLYYYGQFSFEDIGKMLEISRSAVQITHTRAIKKLGNAVAREKGLLT